MIKKEYWLSSSDKNSILHAASWEPSEGVRLNGIIQIVHGVTEHILAYEEIAQKFVEKGYIVIGNDHLGHGTTDGPARMYFGGHGSWNYVVEDLLKIRKLIGEIYPDLKHILIGISLGSFAVRNYLISYPNETNGAILIGTGYTSKIENLISKIIVWQQELIYGDNARTPLINKLAFEVNNKKFSKEGSTYHWLFASKKALNNYLKDPLSREPITVGLFRELLNGMIFTGKKSNIRKMNREIPILIISGEEDPVGGFGRKVIKYVKVLKQEGFLWSDLLLYPQKRHQLLLDENNEVVVEDILDWVKYYVREI